MNNELFPRTWQEFMNSSGYMPVVVNSIERHFDADWSQTHSYHKYYEMVYVKKGISVFDMKYKDHHRLMISLLLKPHKVPLRFKKL